MRDADGRSTMATATSSSNQKILIGICAMHRKATSKPMRAIMSKIVDCYSDYLDYFIFPEQVILTEPVAAWPLCHCLISFHSADFPLHKAIEYVELRKPYVISDLKRQYDLLDRRKVFRTLALAGIEHPRHGVLMRGDPSEPDGILIEHPDHIEVNGLVFNKPFVEKPISAEDHNIYIYYPPNAGGGSQRLFRKINNRSSWYSAESSVRQTGSYIYEDFIPADGTDVKVYAVGPYYAHAEARKAPGLDGKVERDADGKEVRYPVILTHKEKLIARRVVEAFGQTVCGFDLLRANGKSFVCDVNGFSFVKTSTKYYEDTAKILGNMIIRNLMQSNVKIPRGLEPPSLLDLGLGDDPPLVSTPSGKLMELRCVLAIIRHGDRTPKQKLKIETLTFIYPTKAKVEPFSVVVNDQRFFQLFREHGNPKKAEVKLKKPNQLNQVLQLAREILSEKQADRRKLFEELKQVEGSSEEREAAVERSLEIVEEETKTWDQIRTVLEMYGHFSGINRKVQLKYLKAREIKNSDEESTQQGPALLLILKWGGELTTAGNLQAEALGKLFRTLYPGIRRTDGKSSPEDTQGLGFLRLHSTYRHDLKIYASDEGRVQTTAAAFAKGMLALEGELTPILVQMVKSANTDGLLDDDFQAREYQTELKRYLHKALQVDRDFTTEDYQELNPDGLKSIANAMDFIKNPRKMCHEIASYVERMCDVIKWHKINKPSENHSLYLSETLDLAERRWSKELREFRRVNKNSEVEFDISKIPDIYDNIKYDMEHNPELCINNEGDFERMYLCVKNMADIVVPQEYGIKKDNKIAVAQRVCTPLLKKIRNDLHRCLESSEEDESQTRLDPRASQGIATPLRHVRTRLYFTSESHIHTIMNLIRYGGLCNKDDKKWQRALSFLSGVTEFNYMTQVVLMVYEDSRPDVEEKDRFHIELLFSPGLYPCFLTEKERIYENRLNKVSKKHSSEGSSQQSSQSQSQNNQQQPGCVSMSISADSAATSGGSSPSDMLKESSGSNASGSGLLSALSIISPPLAPSFSPVSPAAVSQSLSTSLLVAPSPVANDDISISSTTSEKLAEASGLIASPGKSSHHDSEDDLNDMGSVNLVSLEEIHPKDDRNSKRQKLPNNVVESKAMEEGDKPREDWSKNNGALTTIAASVSTKTITQVQAEESHQETVGASRGKWVKELLDETKKAMNSIKEEEEKKEKIKDKDSNMQGSSSTSTNNNEGKSKSEPIPATTTAATITGTGAGEDKTRRSRFPYRFKHHTVNLLTGDTGVQNRLISTDVIMGKGESIDKGSKKKGDKDYPSAGPAVLSTAVIARSSSEPRLQTYAAGDCIAVGEIKRFWPPLRSLETLHDSIAFQQFDAFLAKLLVGALTPLPSPPKTPLPIANDEAPTPPPNFSQLRQEVEKLKQLSVDDSEK